MVEPQTAERRATSYARRVVGPWRSYNFRWYWTSSATQAFAQGMQFLVIGWLVLEVTGSNTQLGLVLFLYGVPNVGLLMVGGVIADRFDRKRLLMVIQLAVGISIAALAILSLTGVIAIWHVYAAAVLLGSLQALNQPARGGHGRRPGGSQHPAGRGSPLQRGSAYRPDRRPPTGGRGYRPGEHQRRPAGERVLLRGKCFLRRQDPTRAPATRGRPPGPRCATSWTE